MVVFRETASWEGNAADVGTVVEGEAVVGGGALGLGDSEGEGEEGEEEGGEGLVVHFWWLWLNEGLGSSSVEGVLLKEGTSLVRSRRGYSLLE